MNTKIDDISKNAISSINNSKFKDRTTFENAIAAQQEGRFEEAEKFYNKIIEVQPTHPDSNHNLGIIKITQKKTSEALLLFKVAVETNPKVELFWISYVNALILINKLDEAQTSLIKAIKLKPNFLEAHNMLGVTLDKLGKQVEAKICFEKCIKLEPNFANAYNNLARILIKLKKPEDAITNFIKAISINPNFAEAYIHLGAVLHRFGRFDEAKSNYKKAIELKSDFVAAHYNLSQIKDFKSEDKQLINMKNLLLNRKLNNHDLHCINFALGKAFEDLNQFDKSFKYYLEANTIRKRMLNYNISDDIGQFKEIKKLHLNIKENSLKDISSLNKLKPVFIVGMPRSGTTLIEQIISSHTEVFAGGELNYVHFFGEFIVKNNSKVDAKILMNFREKYFKKLEKLSNEKSIITDKMPGNFRFIGLIFSAFPEAKIIHVKRDPAATCWGNFKQSFAKNIEGYNNSLDDLVIYYKLYQDIMSFWDNIYGDKIYHLNYEKLTLNQDSETRKLIQYIGLEWQDECLNPQNNNRIVYTASYIQVRNKVYQGSSDKWKKFKPFLNGKFDKLKN